MTGMGRRIRKDGLEQDVFSRYWRRYLVHKRGERRYAKRKVHKRERQEGKSEAAES